jgi:hypothetical protein
MANKYLKIGTNGHPIEVEATVTSAGAGDSGKIPALNTSGEIDETMIPASVGANSFSLTASESLTAGPVNLFDDAGTLKMRKADATDNGKPANGFVKGSVTSGASGTFYYSGILSGLSSLTLGARYFLSTTAGDVTTTVPTGSGNIVQFLGVAKSATEIVFDPATIIELV